MRMVIKVLVYKIAYDFKGLVYFLLESILFFFHMDKDKVLFK